MDLDSWVSMIDLNTLGRPHPPIKAQKTNPKYLVWLPIYCLFVCVLNLVLVLTLLILAECVLWVKLRYGAYCPIVSYILKQNRIYAFKCILGKRSFDLLAGRMLMMNAFCLACSHRPQFLRRTKYHSLAP